MDAKKLGLIGLLMLAAGGMALAGWTRHVTRPRPLPGVPTRDYQFQARSESIMALSSTPISFTRDAKTYPRLSQKKIKLFQWNRAKLEVDHCSVSRLALQLHDDGDWVLSLRADQNPETEEPAPPEGEANEPRTLHVKRNQFVVKLRCYGEYESPEPAADETTGKPVLFQLGPKQFWVQRAQPKDFWFRGNDDDVKRYFDLIDRVEVELFYRKPPAAD